MQKYIKVEWPEIQDYMEHPRYKECCMGEYMDEESSEYCYFVPEDLYNEVITEKLYPAEFNLPIGHIKITTDEVVLNGITYSRDENNLKRGSKVILYSPDKGYWTTTCKCCAYGFPPIFEDNSILINSEIIGIKNNDN